jgi:5-methylcytosine-specific restriction endonuclease McrA
MSTEHSCLEKSICLQLNKSWQAIGVRSVRQAIICLCGGADGEVPAMALDITMSADGELESAIPTKWEDWVKLPVREQDLSIAVRDGAIRAPTVIICQNYNKVPQKMPRLSSSGIWQRDGGVCQYSGRKLAKSEGNIDHILPRSLGGRDSWENMVLSHKQINFLKGSKTNKEAGLQLLKKPVAPKAVPISFTIRDARHDHWKPFLH